MYVAEGVNYRGKKGRRPEGDRIVILEDTTGAGKADKVTVFTQDTNLESPWAWPISTVRSSSPSRRI